MKSICSAFGYLLLLCGIFVSAGGECVRAPRRLIKDASMEQIVDLVNQDSVQIRELYSTDASVTASMDGRSFPTIRAQLAVQKDNHMRLIGKTTFTGKEVDLGSNDDLFWFWVKRNDPPALYYAHHQQFVNSPLAQQFPVNPKWVMEAMGISPFDPAQQHSGPKQVGPGRLEIRTIRQGIAGEEMKLTVIDQYQGWVLEQHLYNHQGKLIASAIAENHFTDPETGAVVPRNIEIQWPDAKLGLKIDLGNVTINDLGGENAELFAMPELPDAPKINICQMANPTDPSSPLVHAMPDPRKLDQLFGRENQHPSQPQQQQTHPPQQHQYQQPQIHRVANPGNQHYAPPQQNNAVDPFANRPSRQQQIWSPQAGQPNQGQRHQGKPSYGNSTQVNPYHNQQGQAYSGQAYQNQSNQSQPYQTQPYPSQHNPTQPNQEPAGFVEIEDRSPPKQQPVPEYPRHYRPRF